MTVGKFVLLALLVAVAGTVEGGGQGTSAQESVPPSGSVPVPVVSLPSADLLRVQHEGALVPYTVEEVDPVVVTTGDGGAWAFFSAVAQIQGREGSLRIYAARFDAQRGVWLPGSMLPGKTFQWGPTAAVDAAGRVHVVYADRNSDEEASTLLHVSDDGAGGWSAPVAVAPDPDAGFQVTPVLARDRDGGIHLLWREQRSVSEGLRRKDLNNGDVFASDLVGGAWSAPVQISRRPSPDADANAAWPRLAADGDRLIAVWSIYRGTTREEMQRAVRVEWSARPLADPSAWHGPEALVERGEGEIGGALVALTADPRGGVVLAHGSIRDDVEPVFNDLFLRRLAAGSDAWDDDTAILSGDRGYALSMAIAADGTVYLTYHDGRNRSRQVGAAVIPPDAVDGVVGTVLTAGQNGQNGRGAVAVDSDGRPWVVYVRQAEGAAMPTEIRCLRGPWTAP